MPSNPTDIIRATVQMQGSSPDLALNVFHAIVTGVGPFDDNNMLNAVVSWIGNVYQPMRIQMSQTWSFVGIDVYNVTQDYPIGFAAAPAAWNAPASRGPVEVCPPGTAYFVSARTSRKRTYGRKFLPGIPETVNVNGRITGAALTALLSFAVNYVAQYASAQGITFNPGTLDRVTNVLLGFISGKAYADVAYQRRRKYGVGL